MALILGIDDAGRGPVIGPMFLAGVLLTDDQERFLKKEGVADSKQLAHPIREALSKIIQENCIGFHISKSDPKQIDEAIEGGKINLNTLEALKTAEIINELTKSIKDEVKIIVDCPSVNIVAWRKTLLKYVDNKGNLDIHCEHKADVNHPSVSAASILAKVAREDAVKILQDEFGEFGSGYPSDPVTKDFLKKKGQELSDSGIFRKSWATWKELFPTLLSEIQKKKQTSLGDF